MAVSGRLANGFPVPPDEQRADRGELLIGSPLETQRDV